MRYEVDIRKKNDIIDRYRWFLNQVDDNGHRSEIDRGYGFTQFLCRYWARRALDKHRGKSTGNRRNRTVELQPDRTPARKRRWRWGPPEDG